MKGVSMDPDRWLEHNAVGYDQLTLEERVAIKNFAFLWSYFEATCLNKSASASAIAQLCADMAAKVTLVLDDYRPAIGYFSKRYFNGSGTTPEYDGLRLPNDDQRNMVLKAISDKNATDVEVLAGILVIIYRIRNNLVHGEKWAYGIQGQLSNFNHANNVLMAVKSANP